MEIPDDDTTLKEVLKDAVLEGEVIITAITRPLSIAKCLREIDGINSMHDIVENLVKLEEILRKPINREVEKTKLAREDKDIVLAAVQKDGVALQFASEELKKNRKIVLAAVQENSAALAYASIELRNDKKIITPNSLEGLKKHNNKIRDSQPITQAKASSRSANNTPPLDKTAPKNPHI
jgi:signal transduction histidine kinase